MKTSESFQRWTCATILGITLPALASPFSCLGWLVGIIATIASHGAADATPIETPYARHDRLEIRGVNVSATVVPCHARVQLTVDLSATYSNPFDSDDVALDARITGPDGRQCLVPGFLYQPYSRILQGEKETLTPLGEPVWQVRFAPALTGEYSAVVVARDRTGTCESAPIRFSATKARTPGFVRVSPRDRRFFEFEGGQAYFPIGENVCWASARGTFDFDRWFSQLAKCGGNYARLWLSPQSFTFALERRGDPQKGLGMGQLNLGNAWRLDHVLELAERQGIWLMFCIDSYNILTVPVEGAPDNFRRLWGDTPHNVANGGPLHRSTDFWTDPAMDRLYRQKLRYLVARYGASTHVLSWEFWNEVDVTTGYKDNIEPVRAWHHRMAKWLRMIDPYHHLITTSFANSDGSPMIDALPELDYVQTHYYGNRLDTSLAAQHVKKAGFRKPHYVGEVGALGDVDARGVWDSYKVDRDGLQVHDPIWVSLAMGAAGTAAPWWWEMVDRHNLYRHFEVAARFSAGIDWPAQAFRPITPSLEWRDPPQPLPRKDIVLEGGPFVAEKADCNQPRELEITADGVQGPLPLAARQFGVVAHRELHNPVTFRTRLPWATRLSVLVDTVSPYGGAVLTVTLDGNTALKKEFPDTNPPGKHAVLMQYRGAYDIQVPAGEHTVIVENTGSDWVYLSYCFHEAIIATSPPLLAWAMAGNSTALAWLRVEGRTWDRVCARKETIPPVAASTLTLPGLRQGRWRLELWDTWTGKVISAEEVTVNSDGQARIALPRVESDLAVKGTLLAKP